MSTQSSSWYIPGEGKQPAGPFVAEQIIEFWRTGRLSANTICWCEGMSQWLPMSQVEPFASVIRSAGVSGQAAAKAVQVGVLPKGKPALSVPAEASPKRSRLPLILVCAGAGVALLAIFTVVWLTSFGGASAPTGKTINYLPDDTREMVSFDVPAIVDNASYRKFEKLFGRGPHTICSLGEIEGWPLGGALSDISRITFAENYSHWGPVMVLVLKRAILPKDFLKNLIRGGDWVEQHIGGYTFYTNNLEPGKGCFLPDDHTLVFGHPKTIQAALERNGPPNPSSEAGRVLCGVEFSHTVTRAQKAGRYVPILEEGILYAVRWDSALIVGSLESTAHHIDVGPPLHITANWTCRDDESAKKVEISLGESFVEAKAKMKAELLAKPDAGAALERIVPGAVASVRELLDSLTVTRSGRIVKLQFTVSEAFLDLHLSGLDDSAPSSLQKDTIDGGKQRKAARVSGDLETTQATKNLREIAQAIHQYEAQDGHFPPAYVADEHGRPMHSWRVRLLPYLGRNDLYAQYNFKEPWDSKQNRQLIPMMPKVFHNPGDSVQPGRTNYLAVCGEGLAFDGATARRPADFTDGTSNTICIVEADDDHAVIWTKPDDWQFDAQSPLTGLGRAHRNGFNVLFADGSVRLLLRTIDPKLFHSLLTIAGGESIGSQSGLDSQHGPRGNTPRLGSGPTDGIEARGPMVVPPPSTANLEPEQFPGLRTVPRFTEPPLECACPCWSPDGKYVMFVARPAGQLPGGIVSQVIGDLPRNIWVISADGSKKWLVSNFFFGRVPPPDGRRADPLKLDVAAASWSPDGQRIAFLAYEGEDRPIGIHTDLYVMKADATDVFRVAKDDGWGKVGDALQWTPDGKGLLSSGNNVTAMINLEETTLSPLTASGGGEITNACSSRDGKRLAAIVKERAEMGLCVMDRKSRQVKWLTRGHQFGGGGTNYHPRSWSPDAKLIAADAANDVGLDRHIAIFDVASGKERRLVDGVAPSWSPDGKQLVFEGGLGDCGNLYLIGPDGKNLRRITNPTPPGVQMIWGSQPRCSPDGKQVVFRRGQHVWVANLDGSGETCVIQGTDYSRGYEHAPSWPCKWAPFWKPDGSVVFARYSKRDYPVEIEVCATGVNSAGVRRIFVWKSPTVALKSPDDSDDVCWSFDGTKIAFDNNQNIWVAKGDGTDQKRLVGGRNPQWSPDGEKILFARGSEHNEVLCIINADGSNQTQITDPSDGYRAYHSWCPDGKTIAFEGNNGLLVVSVRGGNARRLVWGQQPCWSPDGHKIAFCAMGRLTSDTGAQGPPCVYVMNADGTGMRPVMQVDNTAYGNNLVNNLSWSRDGKHIVFEETAKRGYDYENRHHIWIVDVSEPVFYQASYVASDLLPWKVPKFEPALQPGSSGTGEEESRTPEATQLPPADEKPADQGPLTGTWQVSGGAQFRIVDDGKALTISLVESDVLREFAGKLIRRNGEPDSKSFTGTLQAVFRPDAPKRYSIHVTATLDDSGQLHLRCADWPTWNNLGKKLGTRTLSETWTRQQ